MAKTNQAITAIRDIKLESFVAATLDQIGWNLLSRATSSEGLIIAAKNSPDALIIAADDFEIDRALISNALILLESKAVLTGAQFQDLLRSADEAGVPRAHIVPCCTSTVTVVATGDSGIGGSTCAINLAYEKSRLGRKTLLLDFNSDNPSIARYFDIQRINRSISPSQFGFFLGEVSELSHFPELAQTANDFEEVVIDLGRIPTREPILSGRRLHEVLARWSLQSASSIFIVIRSNEESPQTISSISSSLLQLSISLKPAFLLMTQLAPSARERRATAEKAAEVFDGVVRFLPRDVRAIERAAAERAPLAHIAPKSLFVQEISAMAGTPSKRGR